MENNDRLKVIVSNLQILTDLTNSMMDSEMYPVSFFSQAFDLIQKIQTDIHTLEAGQVEMFASQMKKHQALILSIHQQVRNISLNKDINEQPAPPVSATVPLPPVEQQKSATSYTAKPAGANTDATIQKEDKPKKTSILSRLGIYKEDKNEVHPEENTTGSSSSGKGKQVNMPAPATITKKPAPTIIEEPIKVPVIKPDFNKPLDEPVIGRFEKPVAKATTRPARPTADAITQPEKPTPAPEKTGTTAPDTPPTQTRVSTPRSVNDMIDKKKLSDLRKAFSLNDRFLYRRELFGGNEEAMNKVITILNNKESYKESVEFLEEKLHWNFSNPTVKSFVKILEIRFL